MNSPVLDPDLLARARARALQMPLPPPPMDTARERLRTQCAGFFARAPEPPLYRRADDPVRSRAGELLGEAEALLTQCLLLQRSAALSEVMEPLTQAVLAHHAALKLTHEGKLEEAELAWADAQALARRAVGVRRLLVNDVERLPVFDRATGTSRFDPQPDPAAKVRLICPSPSCRQMSDASFSPRHALQRFECPHCKRPFLAYFGEVTEWSVRRSGRASRHYLARFEEFGGANTRVEVEDVSGAEISVAPGDLLALLYTVERELKGVLNLSSSRVLWTQRPGPCFLATAAFGEGAAELRPFRAFRDEVLLRSVLGRSAVRGYYRAGPYAVAWLSRRPRALAKVRMGLRYVHRWLVRHGY